MLGSGGVFVIPIGDGQGTRSGGDPGLTIESVFSNSTSANYTGLSCNSGTAYQPSVLDARKLVVSFNDGSGSGDQLLPAMDVNYVPFALHATEAEKSLKVGSTPASQVMSVSSGAATPLSAANFAELLLLVNGNSAAYLKSSSLPSCTSGEVLKASGGAFVCVTDSTGADTLAGLTCVDGKILKRVGGAWACGDDDSGVGAEADPTVQGFAKVAPGPGLKLAAGAVAADFGTVGGKIVEGNDSRLSDSRTPNGSATGDLSGSYPSPTVKGLQGRQIASTTAQDGQVYRWNNTGSQWEPVYLNVADLKKSDGTSQFPLTGCAANETLSWSSVTDLFACAAIGSLDASKITSGTLAIGRLPTGTTSSTVAAGDDSRFPATACNSGEKSRWNGVTWLCEADATGGGGGSFNGLQLFTTSGSWTVPSGITKVKVTSVGGGGGGSTGTYICCGASYNVVGGTAGTASSLQGCTVQGGGGGGAPGGVYTSPPSGTVGTRVGSLTYVAGTAAAAQVPYVYGYGLPGATGGGGGNGGGGGIAIGVCTVNPGDSLTVTVGGAGVGGGGASSGTAGMLLLEW